jgi:D-serine deaminase-like pyridoxal phosphate-dependent protein
VIPVAGPVEADAIGREVHELETPAAVVDLERLERNVGRAAEYAAEHALALYPHAKTHKTIEIAALQRSAGARGLTVAKSREAEIMAAAGLGPLVLHYPVVGAAKVERVAAVAEAVPLTVALDSLQAAKPIAAALRRRGLEAELLIEIDVGLRRTGLTPEGAVEMARGVEALGGGLVLAGISCYPGHLRFDAAAIRRGLADVDALLVRARELFAGAGLRCERISGGSTATLFDSHNTCMTELRPGNYALLDRMEARGAFGPEDCALTVHATVVSTSVPGRFVLDAGSKALGEAAAPPDLEGGAGVAGRPDLRIEATTEEHAHGAGDGELPRVGERLALVPNHACTCVNHHDTLFGVRNERVETVMKVVARGALQ